MRMRARKNKSTYSVILWMNFAIIPFIFSWTFPSNFLVNLKPYIKSSIIDKNIYPYSELKSMVTLASSRFTAGFTTNMGVYNVTSKWDECYLEGLVAKAVSEVNLEESSLKMVVTLGARLHPTNHAISEREITAAFQAAEDANDRFLTVHNIMININTNAGGLKMFQNLTHWVKFGRQLVSNTSSTISLGVYTTVCSEFLKYGDILQLFPLLDFVMCMEFPPSLPTSLREGNRSAEIVTRRLTRFRERVSALNEDVRFIGSTWFSSWDQNNFDEFVAYWDFIRRWATTEHEIEVGMYSAFDFGFPRIPRDRETGWWKTITTNDSVDTGNVSFVEKRLCLTITCTETLLEDEIGMMIQESGLTSPSLSVVAAIAVGVTTICVLLVSLILIHRKTKMKRQNPKLSEESIQEFLQGDPSESHQALKLPFDKSYDIPKNDIELSVDALTKIGQGAYGTVFKTFVKQRTAPVAIKITHPCCPSFNLKFLLSEIKVHMYVSNLQHIVSLIGACTQDLLQGRVIIVTELCEGGSLESHLRCQIRCKENLSTFIPSCLRWCAEIASGMEHIASNNVIHADLATRNVLLTANLVSKITDFGLSRHLYNYQTYLKKSQQPLPWRGMALESLRHLEFSTKSDIWSFGVTCWEIFSYGDVPYPGLSWSQDFLKQLGEGLKLSWPQSASEEIFQIMMRCWDNDPGQRGSFPQLVEEFQSMQSKFQNSGYFPQAPPVTIRRESEERLKGNNSFQSLQDLGYIDDPF